uniref:DAZ associated protein 1 n=1 Tax=Molossus molossus TaxID=27622 RepID=A0A7J8I4V0_MOLMO|nr:DAZ associated protein 1 [Molossus molossus]
MNNSGADEIGKLFVGGLDWSTTQETLRSYFSQYGEVVDCVIMKDKTTNQSRGFGFVKFKDPNCVGTVLASRPHTLDGRNIDPKPCTPRGMQPERTRPKEGWVRGRVVNLVCSTASLKDTCAFVVGFFFKLQFTFKIITC